MSEPRSTRWELPMALRPSDQRVLGGALAVALVVFGGWWLTSGITARNRDFEQLPARSALFQVDINAAAWPELSAVPEIGPALAKRIVAAREKRGRFSTHEELLDVPGIGGKTLEHIRPYLAPVEAAEPPAN